MGKTSQANRRCENPNKRLGTCVSIHDCQVLLNSQRDFLVASACGGGFGRVPMVCCSSDTGFDVIPRNDGSEKETGMFLSDGRENTKRSSWGLPSPVNFFPSSEATEDRTVLRPVSPAKSSLLPEPPTCGGEFIDNRIYGGSDTDAYEFPWMAFLEYSKTDASKESVCAGSLINARYVVTAAHCIVGPIVKQKGELIAVRMGFIDYTKSSIFGDENQRWRVEEKIVHENYKQQKTPLHDIALVRLESNVRYSKTIRPICLPSAMAPYNLKADSKLTVVGWGATETRSSSPVKQKVSLALADQKFCRQQYGKFGLSIESTHMCAGGTVANEDSCRGDSGAPLMSYRDGVWILEGIVSFGRRCGLEGWPGVYARVGVYTEWISKKIRA
uniref:CLIP domain-containing serine protease n=1 Tax=Stomoxys calcitrans TaxID=35570 RepID=A0A1I8PC22_STOCA